MEAKPKTRGPYKKHKDGFKVTVKHYVNEKVKIELPYNLIHSPLYVQVIAKQKHISFKSKINIPLIPVELISDWLESPYGMAVVNTERDNIEQIAKTVLDNTADDFKISLVSESYKSMIDFGEVIKLAMTEKICIAYDNHFKLSPDESTLTQFRGIHPFVLYRQWHKISTVRDFVNELDQEIWNFDFYYLRFRNSSNGKYVYTALEPTKLDFDSGHFENEIKDFFSSDLGKIQNLFRGLKKLFA